MLAHSTQHTTHKRTQTGACEENGGNGLDSSNANGRERERERESCCCLCEDDCSGRRLKSVSSVFT